MAKKKKTGPKPKLSDARMRAKMLAIIPKATSLASACAAFGISHQTLRNWCLRDSEFNDAVEAAKELMGVNRIKRLETLAWSHAATDAPTTRWLLARLNPEQYGDQQQTHVHAHAHVISNDPIFLPPEQRRSLLLSLLGQSTEALDEGAENTVVGTAQDSAGDGAIAGADAQDAAKVLPASSVAKANGHAGNGKH